MKLTRRDLFGVGAAGLATTVLPGEWSQGRQSRAKNVIFVVVDGMAASVITMVDHLRQLEEGKRGYWAELMSQEYVVNGLQDTRSLNSVVTDSAAASAAWGSGRWNWNGQLNMFPDGTELRPLTQVLGDQRVLCGLVTTATITHATPAGFAVSCESRSLEARIAEKYLSANVDVLMGGGDAFFNAAKRADKRDLYAEFAARGYEVLKDRSSLLSSKGRKLLGVFDNSHLPYDLDRAADPQLSARIPTLSEMTRVALDRLKGSTNGFLLQIEGAKVDFGGHNNDLAALLTEQIGFEEAMKVAVDFALEDGETLVVITSDHATGGPALNGFGSQYGNSTPGLRKVSAMKSSYSVIVPLIRQDPTAAHVKDVIKDQLLIELTNEESQAIADSIGGKHPLTLDQFKRHHYATLGAMLGNHTGVGWTSLNHTSDHVLVTALGPGKERFAGLTQNTSVFDHILAVKGMRWENPRMTYEEARKHVGGSLESMNRATVRSHWEVS